MSGAGTYAGRRDPRFVAVRRGGLLDDASHRLLAVWAADCAEHVLALFTTARPGDGRPAAAIEAARRWAAGDVSMHAAREAAYAAHAAAREVSGAAQHVARAAGHAAATAHMADHELGPAFYALRAVAAAFPDDPDAVTRERRWQRGQLPPDIAELVLDDMRRRAAKFRSAFGPG
jgi:hypothetical protein